MGGELSVRFFSGRKRWFVLLLLVCLLPGPVMAASVRQVSIEEMLRAAELVFEGRVIALEARTIPGPGSIRTYVTFDILDVLKGNVSAETITLSFLGGTVADTTVAVSGMHLPQLGEKGIYFVTAVEQAYVHPFYGWEQGHVLVKADAQGIERVVTRDNRPIVGVVRAGAGPILGLSRGVARGLILRPSMQSTRALSVETFKQRLRALLEAP